MKKFWLLIVIFGLTLFATTTESHAKGNGLTARQTRAAKIILTALDGMHNAATQSQSVAEFEKRYAAAGHGLYTYVRILPNGEIKRAINEALDAYFRFDMSISVDSDGMSDTGKRVLLQLSMEHLKIASQYTYYAKQLVAGLPAKRPPDNPLSPKTPAKLSLRERQREEKIAKLRSALYDVAQTRTSRADYIEALKDALIATAESNQKPDGALVEKLALDLASCFSAEAGDESLTGELLDSLAKNLAVVMNSASNKSPDVQKAIKNLQGEGLQFGLFGENGQQIINDLLDIASNDPIQTAQRAETNTLIRNLLRDLYKLRDQAELTSEERDTLKTDLMALAVQKATPSEASVQNLADDLSAMCGQVPDTESFDKLLPALVITMVSANYPMEKVNGLIAEAGEFTLIDREKIYPVLKDMKAINTEMHQGKSGY